MTVTNENTVDQFTLTGTGQTLNLSYTILAETHVLVMLNLSETPLVLNSDYTVTVPDKLGQLGKVIMDPGTGVATDVITVERCPPCTQLAVFRQNSRFPAKVNEKTHDQAYMLACKAVASIFGDKAVVIRYPRFEAGNGISPITPVLADRIGDGTGTLAAFNSTGQIDVLSKGTLLITLTLSNDSSLGGGSPDAVNGVTQRAVKVYIDTQDGIIAVAVGLKADLTFNPYTGARFLDGYAAVLAAIDMRGGDFILDEVLRIIVDIDLPALQAQISSNVTSSKIFAGSASGTSFAVTYTKTAAQKWQDLQLYGTHITSSSGSFRVDSIVVSGAGGTSAVNYPIGQTTGNGNSDDTRTNNLICSIIPTDLNQNSITVTVNITTAVQIGTPVSHGLGRLLG